MRPGSRSPLEHRAATDLGRFGLGLKTASFSQCRRLTVVARRCGVTSCAIWDLDDVAARDDWLVEVPSDLSTIPWTDRLGASGALVVWQKLDRPSDPAGGNNGSELVRQLDETVTHLEFVFHRFLSGQLDSTKPVDMYVNGHPLEAFDPFFLRHPATQFKHEERFGFKDGEILIQPVTLPHHGKVTREEWDRHAGPEGYLKNQGFYLYRNRRLILRGTWFGLLQLSELTKLARIRIDIPNDMDADWKIDIKKASAQPPPPIRERLRRIVASIGEPSRKAFRGRGRRRTDTERIPVWARTQDKNRVRYDVNIDHPMIAAFTRDLGRAPALDFQNILTLVASALPVDSLFADVGGSPHDIELTVADDKLTELAESTYRMLRSSGFSPAAAAEMMRSSEPFRSNWASVAKTRALLAHNDEEIAT